MASFESHTITQPPTSGEVLERILSHLSPKDEDLTTLTLVSARDIPTPQPFDVKVFVRSTTFSHRDEHSAKYDTIAGEIRERSDRDINPTFVAETLIRIVIDRENLDNPATAELIV